MHIAVSSPAEIALRRFLPSLKTIEGITFAGMSYHSAKERAEQAVTPYGGKVYPSYEELLADSAVDAVYLPSVPAAHFAQGKAALDAGKHVMLEKPMTVSLEEAEILVALAKEKHLALHENFTFLYHRQWKEIQEIIAGGTIGRVRLIRTAFGFPKKAAGDFRYNKALGGGAFLDAGCYTIRLASALLAHPFCMESSAATSGRTRQDQTEGLRVMQAHLSYEDPEGVDLSGDGVLANAAGVSAQIAFGMDHAYRCALEVWGEKAYLFTGRIFTAPDDLAPTATIAFSDHTEERVLSETASFAASVAHFLALTNNAALREAAYQELLLQARLMEDFRRSAEKESDPVSR